MTVSRNYSMKFSLGMTRFMPRCGRRLNASVHGQTWNEPNSMLGREVSGPAAYQLPVDLILFLADGFISCSFLSRHALADGGYMYRMSYDLHSFMQQQQRGCSREILHQQLHALKERSWMQMSLMHKSGGLPIMRSCLSPPAKVVSPDIRCYSNVRYLFKKCIF